MATTADTTTTRVPEALEEKRLRKLSVVRAKEWIVKSGLVSCTLFSVLVTAAIVFLLFGQTVTFFNLEEGVTLREFFTGLEWNPKLGSEKHFGIWPLINGTFLVTLIAILVALPLGLITAVFLSEYAPRKLRAVLKPILEVLAGIPTVVYGFFALTVITPFLRDTMGIPLDFFNALSAGIAVGILCIPTVSSLSEDALQAVPRHLREAAYGLGGTKFDVAIKVVLPAALSGIVSAFLLAIARAIGETMIVVMVAGATPRITANPTQQIQTMTSYITNTAKGDLSNFGVEYFSIYAVALTLFVITLVLTLIGNYIRLRFRESYQ
jgi:phosphate transport system permease protein